MQTKVTREEAWGLLRKYNQEEFHLIHGLTVEGAMRWFARELGYGQEEDFWGLVGLLHDGLFLGRIVGTSLFQIQ